MKLLITVLCLAFVITANAQTSCIKLTRKQNNMTGFTGAHSYLRNDASCSKDKFTGKFVRFYYGEDDNEGTPIGMYVDDINSRRVLVPFLEEEEISCLTQYEKNLYENFFVKNKSYRWTVWRCGAGGNSDPFLFSVSK